MLEFNVSLVIARQTFEPILDCFISNFKLKYEDSENIKVDRVNIKVDRVNIKVDRVNIKVDRVNIKVDRVNIKVDRVNTVVFNLHHLKHRTCVFFLGTPGSLICPAIRVIR